jgi:putative hemolysin
MPANLDVPLHEAQTSTAAPTTQVTQGSTTTANPASVYCGQNGGTLEIKKDATGGEYGICTFANKTSCEEWALFRGEGCKAGNATPAKQSKFLFYSTDSPRYPCAASRGMTARIHAV